MSKPYSNTDETRQKYQSVSHAIDGLGRLGISVKFVSFEKEAPLIIISAINSDKLQGKVLGGGINLQFNKQYLQIGVLYRGCHVQWRKYRGAENYWECACANPAVESLHCVRCNNKNLTRENS